MAPLVDQLVARNDKVLLRKVDIGARDSGTVRQAAAQYGMKSIPFYCVYDGKGTLVGKISDPELGAVDWAIRKALAN